MEAPVPASALIHSATLVSAGIYLLLRLNNLFELSMFSVNIIAIIGSITALYGGLVSMYQSDTKRILAYSTISHCGFLMVIYTTGVLEYVILYLYVHGFFKAATFLSVGNVIRFSRNIQDFKRMGHYYKFLPYDCFATFICLINLGGLPLTYGFYIKHLLFVGLNSNSYIYYFVLINCFLGALTGLFYSSRLFYNVFFDTKKSKKAVYVAANRSNLNSKHYINTTLAANIAILLLVLVSYTVSIYLFYTYTSYINIQSDIGKFFNYSSYISLLSDSSSTLLNFSFIN
jgi:NADH-quinone oxidoreductase subunit L